MAREKMWPAAIGLSLLLIQASWQPRVNSFSLFLPFFHVCISPNSKGYMVNPLRYLRNSGQIMDHGRGLLVPYVLRGRRRPSLNSNSYSLF
uniref:Putative secreted protein n=1 Tax=Anopheles darlingi TaxID=43151 RepID=A0A2M4DIG2_ANODA